MSHFISSEAIFEVIGDYPVVDQFDVLYSSLQTGSYLDNYVTGSMLTINKLSDGRFTFSPGTRGLAFSRLGIPRNSFPAQNRETPNRSYNLQPWRERAGIIRNVKIFSNAERYYDSLMPSLSELAKQYGVDIKYFGPNNPRAVLELGTHFMATPNAGRGFLETFVFEPRFANVKRLKNLAKGFVPTVQGTGTTQEIQTVKNFYIFSNDYLYSSNHAVADNISYSYLVGYTNDELAANFNYGPGASSSDIGKVIYGYGDWNPRTRRPNIDAFMSESYRYWPVFRSGSFAPVGGQASVCGPIIRGWRYGVHDASPHYTSCVFRRDRYGQFRDMLEQRMSPVSYVDVTSAPTRNFGDFESTATPIEFLNVNKQQVTIDYPVKVTFVRQQTVTLGASLDDAVEILVYSEQKNKNLTWSSNLSNYATSSLPFFDLERDSIGRNRGEIPDSLIDAEEIVATL